MSKENIIDCSKCIFGCDDYSCDILTKEDNVSHGKWMDTVSWKEPKRRSGYLYGYSETLCSKYLSYTPWEVRSLVNSKDKLVSFAGSQMVRMSEQEIKDFIQEITS